MPTFRFGFKKGGTIGKVSPEQQAVLDRLQAGEITPDEAAKQLGGHAHVFEFGTAPKADEESDSEPRPEVLPALADPGLVRKLHALLAAITAVLVVATILGGPTVHDHALTAVVFALLSLILFAAIAGATGLGSPPRSPRKGSARGARTRPQSGRDRAPSGRPGWSRRRAQP